MNYTGKTFEYLVSDGTKRVATCTSVEYHPGLKKNVYNGISPFGNKVSLTREEIHKFI